ncbi:LOW QUALITY PROTEIN: hypothetical protein ACHAWF_015973 [Thalassiosira exigua]
MTSLRPTLAAATSRAARRPSASRARAASSPRVRPGRRSLSLWSSSTTSLRLRRSVHFVPADNPKFLTKCLDLGADTIVLDLEDSVRDKSKGREVLRSFLESDAFARVRDDADVGCDPLEVLVRINPLSSGDEDWRSDLEVGFGRTSDGARSKVDGFVVPKVESRDELRALDDVVTRMEDESFAMEDLFGRSKVLLPIVTETPTAVLRMAEIARGPRVAAIAWGCEDLSAELGSFGTRDADGEYLQIFQQIRSQCLLAARAAGVQAIDGIYRDVRDARGFEKEAREAKYVGFDGKLTLHPDQISGAHRAFEPTDEELEDAEAIASAWEDDDGRGSLEHKGKMIDAPHYARAKKVIARSTKKGGGRKEARSSANDGAEEKEAAASTPSSTDDARPAPASSKEGEDEVFPRVHFGKYYEDLTPGLTIRHFLTRTVTEADNVFFTCLTLNPAPIHLDHELSKGHGGALSGKGSPQDEGKPLFNSMFTLALLVGMSVPESTHGTTVANLGFAEVAFPKPVYPGDTLRAETEVVDRRESKSRPEQGIVTLRHVAYNQRGEVVCKATRNALMKKRPGYPGDALRAETEDRRESKSRPEQGILTLRHVAYNQQRKVVCGATRSELMKKWPYAGTSSVDALLMWRCRPCKPLDGG